MTSASEPLITRSRAGSLHWKERKPFSKLDCILWPESAASPLKTHPYATLKVKVVRASGLLNDLTVQDGHDFFTNPYVFLTLNGKNCGRVDEVATEARPSSSSAVLKECRTSSQFKTLAPTWNAEFEIDVYHPMAILTLQVFDDDTILLDGIEKAKNLVQSSDKLKLLEDDHIGYLDLYVGLLPVNQRVSAWFNIRHARHWSDSLNRRLKEHLFGPHDSLAPGKGRTDSAPESSGRILLEFEMVMEEQNSEAFAMCLYSPDLGHGLSELSLGEFYDDVMDAKHSLDRIIKKINLLDHGIKKFSTPICTATVVALWNSYFILPFWLGALYLALHYFGTPGNNSADWFKDLAGKASSSIEIKAALIKIMGPAIVSKMDAKGTLGLRKGHGIAQRAKYVLMKVEKALEHPWEIIALPLFILLVWFHYFRHPVMSFFIDHGRFILRVALTILLTSVSFVGRTARGFYFFKFKHPRAGSTFCDPLEDSGQDRIKDSQGQPSARRLTTGSLRGLVAAADADVGEEVTRYGRGRPHRFKQATLYVPKWCNKSCGAFMWGLSNQAWECTACGRLVCSKCNKNDSEDCTHSFDEEEARDRSGSLSTHLPAPILRSCSACSEVSAQTEVVLNHMNSVDLTSPSDRVAM